MTVKFTWQRSPSQAWKAAIWIRFLMQAVERLLLYYAAKIEADMKQNATWTDRTSNARQSLAAFVYTVGDKVILVAKQQMAYGKWLELAHGGKYAIVLKTLQLYYQPVWRDVKAVVA